MMTPKRLAGELERCLDGPHADEHTTEEGRALAHEAA
jgi:hypothetical protein